AFWPQLHAAHLRAAVDWPDPDPCGSPDGITLEGFRQLISNRGAPATQLFVAHTSTRWVGYTGVAGDPDDPTVARTGPTAVDPSYRGRGIATALKAAALVWATRAGFS